MKVCLIKIPTFEVPKSLSYFGSVPSIGLAYVAAAVRKAGHEVQVVDAPGEAITKFTKYESGGYEFIAHGLTESEIVDRIDPDTQVIGLTNMFLHEWPFLKDIMRAIKLRFPNVTLVAGGENATAWWDYMLRESTDLDVCVLGEGEVRMTELLANLQDGRPLIESPGLAIRVWNGKATKTEGSPRIKEIDDLEWPAFDLFPIDAYLDQGLGSGVDRGRSIPMLTSRGCPFQCTFCSSPLMWTTRYVARDPEKVADEIEYYVKRYKISNVNFNDLTAVLTKKWVVAFCKVLLKRNINISWQLPSGTRSEAIDEEAAEYLYKSGCRNFGFAPESGSPRILKLIKKKVTLPKLIKSLRGTIKQGMMTQANFIIGFPDETLKDLFLTYVLLIRMAFAGLHAGTVMLFAPYPGSALYRELNGTGRVTVEPAYIFSTILRSGAAVRSYHPKYSTMMLLTIQWFYLLSFYGVQYLIRPNRILKVIVNFFKGKQESIMDQFLQTKFKQFFRPNADEVQPQTLA